MIMVATKFGGPGYRDALLSVPSADKAAVGSG
jgi:hypothetical protein